MKKKLIILIILNLFFTNFIFAKQIDKTYNFELHIKYTNIKNIKNYTTYGISYYINHKFTNWNINWGIKYGFEGDCSIFTNSNSETTSYASLVWLIAPLYYIKNNLQIFIGEKFGYFIFSNNVGKLPETEGDTLITTAGMKYIINHKINFGIEFNKGRLYFKSQNLKINEYGLFLGYQF